MPEWEARAFASVPGRSVRPGRTPPVPGHGESPGPVRNHLVTGTVLVVPRVRLRASRNSRRQSRSGFTRAGALQRHGLYHQWTRKKNGKTATRILTDDQLADYQPWFGNHRRLRELIAELEDLSLAIAEADPRWNR